MSMDYFQAVVLDENVQMLGFLMVASSAGQLAMVCWAPIFIHAGLICSEIATNPSQVTGVFLTLVNLV